jgi:hypothetical protein
MDDRRRIKREKPRELAAIARHASQAAAMSSMNQMKIALRLASRKAPAIIAAPRSRRRWASGCRCSHDSATPDAFTFTMRYPVEEALRAKAGGGIAEIAHGI